MSYVFIFLRLACHFPILFVNNRFCQKILGIKKGKRIVHCSEEKTVMTYNGFYSAQRYYCREQLIMPLFLGIMICNDRIGK